MTETPDEISIIVEEEALALLDRSVIDVCSITWRTLHITVGTVGLSTFIPRSSSPQPPLGRALTRLFLRDPPLTFAMDSRVGHCQFCCRAAGGRRHLDLPAFHL